MEEKKQSKKLKILLPIPIILLIISIAILINGYSQTGEWFLRSVELKGGTIITITNPPDIGSTFENAFSEFGTVNIRELKSFTGNSLSIEIGGELGEDIAMQKLAGLGIKTEDVSIQTIGSSISSTFWSQAQFALIAAFVLMSAVVFVVFRSFVPSMAVILSAFSDIVATLALMQAFGIELSFASLAALLTLIGYSVDTDVLLTTRVLKGTGTMGERLRSAMKTGFTMTFTTLGALIAIILVSVSQVLTQIAMVLLIGLIIDMANTWIQNAAILVWHAEKRGVGNA